MLWYLREKSSGPEIEPWGLRIISRWVKGEKWVKETKKKQYERGKLVDRLGGGMINMLVIGKK